MYMDKQNLFSEAQAITVTAVSTNAIDLRAVAPDIGTGENLYIVITVDETFDTATTSNLTVTLVTDADPALGSATIVATYPVFADTVLTAGREPIYLRIPPGTYERYIGLTYTVSATMTAGKVTAGIVLDIQRNKSYPRNYVPA